MLTIITGRPPGCLTRMRIPADNISNQRQFLRAGNPVPKKQPCIDPTYATTFLCPHSPLLSLSVCPPMICALICSNKPQALTGALDRHGFKQSSRGLDLAVDTITAHPEWTGIEVRTNPCHGGPSVTLLAYPASARVRDLSPRAGSEVYESRPAGYTKTYCVPTCVNALLFLHSAASDDVLEQWRNLNPIPGCLRVNFLTSGRRCPQVPCSLVLAPLTIKRHHRANNNRDRLDGPPCPSDFSVPHPTKLQAPRLPTH